MRRIPLWLTMVPLVAAVGLYWLLWSGWARDFEATLAGWLPGTEMSARGFPYRLEVALEAPQFAAGEAVKVTASAARAQINRGPWRPELTVVTAEAPRFSAVVSPVIAASVAGKSATTSVKVIEAKLARLSAVIEAARVRFGFSAMPLAADSLELHLRERIPAGVGAGPEAGPAGAPRGQIVVAGERARFGGGDALTLKADVTVTGAARLLGYDNWAAGGTMEVTQFSLADAHGEVASARATLVPIGRTGLRYAGTVTTICPGNVIAAFEGLPPVAEKRLRSPVRLAFEGLDGAMRISGVPAGLARRPVRAQLPPCPVVRGGGGSSPDLGR